MTQPVFPEPIGALHYDPPRAVKVRDPRVAKDITAIHSAVYGAISFYVDNQEEADKVIGAWGEAMKAANLKFLEILGRDG